VWVAIVPEHGNFLIDTADFAPARGRVVARIINEGSRADSATGLAGGQSAYWFVERDSVAGQRGRLRSLIIRAADATVLKVRSLEVCHRPPPNDVPRGPKADFVDAARECRGLPATPPPGGGEMGLSINLTWLGAAQAFYDDWIPCTQGCCIGR
jgi:hypothetical protein